MCKLYSLTRAQEEIGRLSGVMRDLTGNLPPLPGIYPDTLAPIAGTAEHVPLTHTFGPNVLRAFRVWTDEIEGRRPNSTHT